MKLKADTKSSTVIEMGRLNEEIVSPESYLKLTYEQRRGILKVTPLVKRLGTTDLEDSSFTSLLIKWKNPRYKAIL